jgi:hypothetical protein
MDIVELELSDDATRGGLDRDPRMEFSSPSAGRAINSS